MASGRAAAAAAQVRLLCCTREWWYGLWRWRPVWTLMLHAHPWQHYCCCCCSSNSLGCSSACISPHPPTLLQSKRGLRSGKASAGSKASGSLASKGGLAAAAASGKATLPLDKGRTSSGSSMAGVRPPSSSRLATQLQQTQPQP